MNIQEIFANLTDQEKVELKTLLHADGKKSLGQSLIEKSPNNTSCPNCQSENFVKNGKNRGIQRLKCKDCGTTFSLRTNTVVHYSHKPLVTWERYIQLMFDGYSIRKIAKELKVSKGTAFYWRHKILSALKRIANSNLSGIVEADEVYFALSFKGQKSGLPRKARRRGRQVKKRGTSKDQVCVLTAIDREKNDWMKPVCLGNLSKTYLDGDFAAAIAKDAVFVTDNQASYPSFAAKREMTHRLLYSRQPPKGAYHLQNVNSLHSQLKRFMRRFNGVATKYLDNYLVFWQWRNRDLLADLASRRDAVSYRALAGMPMALV